MSTGSAVSTPAVTPVTATAAAATATDDLHDRPIWTDGDRVLMIDQTLLPGRLEILAIESLEAMWEAIKALRVRGAPAIGIAAVFGAWLGVKHRPAGEVAAAALERACTYLETSRPTAVNLFWATRRARALAAPLADAEVEAALLADAVGLMDEDNDVCLAIGRHGAALLADGARVLTHCNAGGLATARWGTALSIIYWAVEREGKRVSVFADETRPLLQGSRLTAWELGRAGIDVTLICDSMAASVMARGWVDAVIVGTDRVAANGDFANKIGTYGVAVLAREHGIPFYVAAPLSSVDFDTSDGAGIPIEERHPDEVTTLAGIRIAPEGVKVYNPAFDVTPARYVTAFITERGVVRAPFGEGLAVVRG